MANPLGMGPRALGGFEVLEQRRLLATFTVTTSEDVIAADGLTSLREAIDHANADPDSDTIVFAESVQGTIRLTSTDDADGQTDLDINSPLTINGPGAGRLTIDGNLTSRVFHVDPTVVTITGLGIMQGNPAEGEHGGGILNRGDLTLEGCVVMDNQTRDQTVVGGSGGSGGGIASYGTLKLIDCSVSGNRTGEGGPSGGGGRGGGIVSSGTLMLTACTVSGNRTGNGELGGWGGGIFSSGTLVVLNSTVSGNSTGDRNGKGGGLGCGAVEQPFCRLPVDMDARKVWTRVYHGVAPKHTGKRVRRSRRPDCLVGWSLR